MDTTTDTNILDDLIAEHGSGRDALIPILQGLLGAGMGKGPALALLLAGPALSLPNMLVIRSVMGTKKTVVFVSLTVLMATFSGILFGMLSG